MTINLYFVRHGQTLLNQYNRLQGWADSPLTAKGIADVTAAGQRLKNFKFDACYYTGNTRTLHSAQLILAQNETSAHNLQPQALELLREQGFGYFETEDANQVWLMAGATHGTRTHQDIIDQYGFAKTRDFLHEVDPFGDAEDNQTYWNRIEKGFDYLRQHHEDGQNILILNHSFTTRGLVDRYAPELGAKKLGPRNGAVTKFALKDNGLEVIYYNRDQEDAEY